MQTKTVQLTTTDAGAVSLASPAMRPPAPRQTTALLWSPLSVYLPTFLQRPC